MKCVVLMGWLGMMMTASARVWTTRLGRTFEADLVRMDGAGVHFVMSGGRAFQMPLTELSVADQSALTGRSQVVLPSQGVKSDLVVASAQVVASFGKPWPQEVRLDGPVACKVISEDVTRRRYIYESPGYRFTCDARITDDALRNFSVMFEATRKYALALPISLGGEVERTARLDIQLFGSMQSYVMAGGAPHSAGLCVGKKVLVPMASLGLKEIGTGFSLDNQPRHQVLVHELVHQLTPQVYFAVGARGWFSEGLAEYVAITPYHWGYFRPDVHGNVVKSYVTGLGSVGSGGRALGTQIVAPKLRSFLLMPYQEFSGERANANYGLGLLLTHYFFHMEGGGKAMRISQFLQGMQAGRVGEEALKPLLNGGTYEKLEGEIAAAWARMGVQIRFGG